MPVEGIEGLAALARDLKEAGNKGATKELRQGLQRSAKPIKAAAKAGALAELPAEGGLGAEVAASRFSTRVNLLGRNPAVKLIGAGRPNQGGRKHDLDAMDRGRLRHPTYGRTNWVTQLIDPGWFTRSVTKALPEVRRELDKAIDSLLDKLGRG